MATTKLQFRIATLDDAAQIQQLIQAAFRAEDSRENWTGDMGLASGFSIGVEEITPGITNPNSDVLIATDDNGQLVGSITVVKRGTDVARLALLAVDQKLHRGGIGRQVLTYAQDYCRREWGVKKLGLNALSTRQELIAWYMRFGFRKTGEESPFPYERFSDRALPDGLCFFEMEKDLEAV
ncbi:hypothetical protein FZEAL_4499 [Fusarium zealandicum]|uniref:N-acetyltransferase domain-containing protein n=1 Tax=Fusarium zealandicum TaxID=1053134 RepID=A0A8H4UM98_9HYPO|nr:hypothetical protein FZEAL_4499 [Fusarium zealandicum]